MSINIKNKSQLKRRLTSAGDKLVVVDFHATWCGPCKRIAPKLEELAEDTDDLVVLKVDVDECEELAEEFEIESMPTFVFFKNKQKINEFSGGTFSKLQKAIERRL